MDIGLCKWGYFYFNCEIFCLFGDCLLEYILLILVYDDDCLIVGVFNLIGLEILYGCYWGCIDICFFLYFEICYYQVIDFVIEYGFKVVEVGVQGGYKFVCGYVFVMIYFVYWIVYKGFRDVIGDYFNCECQVVQYENYYLN